MSSNSPEIIEILKYLCDKLKESTETLSSQAIGNILNGLQGEFY